MNAIDVSTISVDVFVYLGTATQEPCINVVCPVLKVHAVQFKCLCTVALEPFLQKKKKVDQGDSNSRLKMPSQAKFRRSLIRSFLSFRHATVIIDMSKEST